eukprot:TRINITY_DN30700_c0_g1_i1.p1 TRINITY_DN30700_c0_g1~~TRINITY_DN30700_c0_g1_i1.p1  ORF type:complete len:458 (+),score=120.76 TRINITY_DN30700_c0_g1_i1:50-1375(+)
MAAPPSAARVGAVNVLGGLLFGWVAIGVNTGVGVLWPCLYGIPGEDSWTRAALQTVVNVGGAAGAVSGGAVAEMMGLRRELIMAALLSATCFFSSGATSIAAQMAIRFVTGFGVGLVSQAAPQYVGAAAPEGTAGKLGTLFQVAVTLGIVLASVASAAVVGEEREDAFCQNRDSAHLHGVSRLLFNPPAGLACALAALAVTLPDRGVVPSSQGPAPTPSRTWILGGMGCVALQLTGINAVMFYSRQFFELAGYEHQTFGSVCVMTWNFLTTLVALSCVDRFGRRPLMITALTLIFVSILCLAPASHLAAAGPSPLWAYVCFFLLGVYILGFELGPGSLFWVYLIEVTPQGSRLFPVANAGQWTLTIMVTFGFPPLQAAMGPWVFWIFLLPAAAALAFHARCLPETKTPAAQAKARRLLAAKEGPWSVWAAEGGPRQQSVTR